MTTKKRHYGYVPDSLDARDHVFEKVVNVSSLPASVDLAPKMPPVVDQGQLGSCTGNGVAGCVDFLHCAPQVLPGKENFPSSRLQIYYDERVIEGTVKSDSGAQIRDGVKVVNKTGAALESLWPYVISKFKTKPSAKALASAAKRKITSYQRITTLADMKACLAAGFPFVFGFSVPSDFEGNAIAKTGEMVWDKKQQVVGGHCVCGVGYDDAHANLDGTTGAVKCRNSWSSSWGLAGHFWMPYAFIGDSSCANDFWTLRKG